MNDNVIHLLPEEQHKFAELLNHYQYLKPFWNWEKKECDIDALTKRISTISHAEAIIAKFFLSLWTHENHGFDIFEAVSTLDDEDLAMINHWMNAPFWP